MISGAEDWVDIGRGDSQKGMGDGALMCQGRSCDRKKVCDATGSAA